MGIKEEIIYPVVEMFSTLQGEGKFTGHPAFFIRLAGCDVGCHWCDIKESWDSNMHPVMSVNEIVDAAVDAGISIAVITGGEPLLHNLNELTRKLRLKGIRTHLETSGTNQLSGEWDWICFSPKKFKAPVSDIYNQANELKIIVYNQHDLKWGDEIKSKISHCVPAYFQPEWSVEKIILPDIIEYIKKHSGWALSIQSHKYINIK